MPAGLRVCLKITNCHICPSTTEMMRVKLATQILRRSMASGIKYYNNRNVLDLLSSDTREFTVNLNDLFDALNRRCKKEVTCNSRDFAMITFGQKWIDELELELEKGIIVMGMLPTRSTSEGLRVTL